MSNNILPVQYEKKVENQNLNDAVFEVVFFDRHSIASEPFALLDWEIDRTMREIEGKSND